MWLSGLELHPINRKGCGFDSLLGHITKLWVRSPVGQAVPWSLRCSSEEEPGTRSCGSVWVCAVCPGVPGKRRAGESGAPCRQERQAVQGAEVWTGRMFQNSSRAPPEGDGAFQSPRIPMARGLLRTHLVGNRPFCPHPPRAHSRPSCGEVTGRWGEVKSQKSSVRWLQGEGTRSPMTEGSGFRGQGSPAWKVQ